MFRPTWLQGLGENDVPEPHCKAFQQGSVDQLLIRHTDSLHPKELQITWYGICCPTNTTVKESVLSHVAVSRHESVSLHVAVSRHESVSLHVALSRHDSVLSHVALSRHESFAARAAPSQHACLGATPEKRLGLRLGAIQSQRSALAPDTGHSEAAT
eukprot:359636-Chlamydomonas_euryale.AAC.8